MNNRVFVGLTEINTLYGLWTSSFDTSNGRCLRPYPDRNNSECRTLDCTSTERTWRHRLLFETEMEESRILIDCGMFKV